MNDKKPPQTTADRERALSRTVDIIARDIERHSNGKIRGEAARKEAVESVRRVDRNMRDGD